MRTALWLLLLVGLCGGGSPVWAQLSLAGQTLLESGELGGGEAPQEESWALQRREPTGETSLFHVVGEAATLYNRPDSTAPVARLPVRTPVHRFDCSGAWCRVRTDEGRTGYVPATSISNVWIRVSKENRRVYLYQGPDLVNVFKADIGYNTFSDKKRQGSRSLPDHWRTPEGTFYVVRKNPQSQFYKALVLNYPTIDDARRGLKQDLISRGEYEAIVRAQQDFEMPPMDTELGGWIEIHGEGTGAATTWTQGCVAVHNDVMNELWIRTQVGTPVFIE